MMQVDVVGWGPSLKLNEEDTLGWYTPAAFDPFLLLAAGRMGTTPWGTAATYNNKDKTMY